MHLLFTYGTLRDPAVQQAVFGRLVDCEDDSLPGFRVEDVLITDPDVLAASGLDRHPMLRRDPGGASVHGGRLQLTDSELAAADRYEVDDYERVEVVLASGHRAWAYASAQEAADLRAAFAAENNGA
ncbi:gamma-glutamylcyclotransferase family protein [Rhodococcus yananensis]|uniref:gamma-glutamylcyclotransferase family protein n=1 Tax=Rhodococcus yananensis TaxID=2879464 RepID=UPI001CF856C3|nr:gamma-glutamylcyclotransferase family protein [Rhodococcus yananensis]